MDIEKTIIELFDVPVKCHWTYSNTWKYYSVKGRKPDEDRVLLESGKIPYCSCTVNCSTENIDIDEDEESGTLSITFSVLVNIDNKEVHN